GRHGVLAEPEAGEGSPPLDARASELREVVRGLRRLQRGGDDLLGRPSDVAEARQAAPDLPHGGAPDPHLRLRGAVDGQGHGGLLQIHHHRHVRQGRPGDEGRGRREVGRAGTAQDLRLGAPGWTDPDPTARRASTAAPSSVGRDSSRAPPGSWASSAAAGPRRTPRGPNSTSSAGTTSCPPATRSSDVRSAKPDGPSAPPSPSRRSTPTTSSRASPPPSSRAPDPTSSCCCTTGPISTRPRWWTSPTSPSGSGRTRGRTTPSPRPRPGSA